MKLDFTKNHRVTIDGQDYPLHGFKMHPKKTQSTIPPAGISREAEAAMSAETAKGAVDWSGSSEFSCDFTLNVGEVYDYTPPSGATEKIQILDRNGHNYRGRVV